MMELEPGANRRDREGDRGAFHTQTVTSLAATDATARSGDAWFKCSYGHGSRSGPVTAGRQVPEAFFSRAENSCQAAGPNVSTPPVRSLVSRTSTRGPLVAAPTSTQSAPPFPL